jgi:hypothetical protein
MFGWFSILVLRLFLGFSVLLGVVNTTANAAEDAKNIYLPGQKATMAGSAPVKQ